MEDLSKLSHQELLKLARDTALILRNRAPGGTLEDSETPLVEEKHSKECVLTVADDQPFCIVLPHNDQPMRNEAEAIARAGMLLWLLADAADKLSDQCLKLFRWRESAFE